MSLTLLAGKPLVDIVLAQAITYTADGTTVDKTHSFDTASEASVEPSLSEGSENILRVKNKILAIDRKEDIAIGYDVGLTNSTLIIELLQLIDGGTFKHETPGDDLTPVVGYSAPATGTPVVRQPFDLVFYAAEKDTAGDIVGFVKFTFKNTKGSPVSYMLKDGEFYVPQMTLKSRPKDSETPVELDFVDTLPTV